MQAMALITNFEKIDISTLKYKIPEYLSHAYTALIMNNDIIGATKFLHNLIFSLGNGESLWKNIKIKKFSVNCNNIIINLPLFTKKECNLFLNVPENIIVDYFQIGNCTALYVAILYALIFANNGSKKLFWFLNHFRKFRKDILYEKIANFKYKIIKWLCKIENEIKNDDEWNMLNPMIDYLLYKFENDPNYSLKGRTFNSVLKQTEIWHKELKINQFKDYPQIWKPENTINCFEQKNSENNYSITEILNIQELYDEGKELSHCVLSYIKNIHLEKASIWSVKQNNKRLLTIEINSQKQIIQIRGYKNRLSTLQEMLILDEWFNKEGLNKTEGNMGGF